MMQTTLIFTPIPWASADGAVHLTVVVSPRLVAPGPSRLDAFELGQTAWPSLLAQLQFRANVDGQVTPATLAPPAHPSWQPDPAVWRGVFPGSTPVDPWTFDDDRGRQLHGFAAAALTARILELYGAAMTAGGELPFQPPLPDAGCTTSDPSAPPVPCGSPTGEGRLEAVARQLVNARAAVRASAFTPADGSPDVLPDELELARALRFYRRNAFTARGMAQPPHLDQPPPRPVLDFHRRVALCGDHPTLLRKLGLAFELELPGVVASALAPAGTITIEVDPIGAMLPQATLVAYQAQGARVAPAPRDPAFASDGYLRLDNAAAFSVLQLDADGAVLSLADFATACARRASDPDQPPITSTTLPALRNGGFTIAHADRLGWVAQAVAMGGALVEMPWIQAGAEELMRGFRVDVDDGRGWRSLCRRVGQIAAGAVPAFGVDDQEEGLVKAASGASHDTAPEHLYVHDAIAGWDGWSLCAARPGLAIVHDQVVDPDGTVRYEEHVRAIRASERTGFHLKADYRPAPGTLPQLRFGKTYRFRARIADLAGGGVPFTDPDDRYASPWQRYERFEPVPPPAVIMRRPISEAESVEHVVIRSQPGVTPAQYAAGDGAAYGYHATADRHLLPPKAPLALAEQHGMLDRAFDGVAADRAAAFRVARKERGTLIDPTVVDHRTGAEVTVTDLVICDPAGPTAAAPPERGDPLPAGHYAIRTAASIEVPYLPDPLTAGLALRDVAGEPTDRGAVVVRRAYPRGPGVWGTWAGLRSLRIKLVGGADPDAPVVRGAPDPSGDGTANTIVFSVPPGRTVRLAYSSLVAQPGLEAMALFAAQPAAWRAANLQPGLDGQLAMVSPARELVLVHAIQRPARPPAFATPPTVIRAAGDPTVRLTGRIDVHGYSTGDVDVRASWTDLIDDPAAPAPQLRAVTGSAFRLPIAYGARTAELDRTSALPQRQLRRAARWLPALAIATTAQDHHAVHELGDTRHRAITYTPVGTTRYLEYFPAAVIEDADNVTSAGPGTLVDAPAAAAPPAPRPRYVVPTIRRTTDASGTRHRHGGGLRIYLERPWFVSGAGERVAILIASDPSAPSPALQPAVSAWGADPLWSAPPPHPIEPAAFAIDATPVSSFPGVEPRARVVVVRGLAVPGVPAGDTVTAIAIVPEWSAERQLWFADVDVAAPAGYGTMISLALARYQPDALPGLALSPPVRAQFAQLLADRAATVTFGAGLVEVAVVGPSAGNRFEPDAPQPGWPSDVGAHDGAPGAGHRVTAWIEARPAAAAGHDLAWEPSSARAELIGASQGDDVRWSGGIALPSPQPATEYRLVIVEHELFEADPDVADEVCDHGQLGQIPVGRRAVYVETLAIAW